MTECLSINYALWGRLMENFVVHLNRLKLTSKIYHFTHIYAPPRGGLPIAVHLSHNLNLKMIYGLYNFSNCKTAQDSNLLIVDDIVDTGKTFENIKEKLKMLKIEKYLFASIHSKPHSSITPDIFLHRIPDDTWVIYPFECKEKYENDKIDFQKRRGIHE